MPPGCLLAAADMAEYVLVLHPFVILLQSALIWV
jgi:hypothetical protein